MTDSETFPSAPLPPARKRPGKKPSPSLDEMWDASSPGPRPTRDCLAAMPPVARRYLDHAIAHDALLPEAVRLRMHGAIRLGGRWLPFEAEQAITRSRGFLWCADAHFGPVHIKGYDRSFDGAGAMRWDLFGLFPVVRMNGRDIDRSAAARYHGETVWLPSELLDPRLAWGDSGDASTTVQIDRGAEHTKLSLDVDETGALRALRFPRWGDAGGNGFSLQTFGGVVENERTFQGITIPSVLRVGWFPQTERFGPEGEFFRATIDDAVFR